MTIDEAIKERQKVIEVQEKLYEDASTNESKKIIKSSIDNDCQLAEWWKELKELREKNKVLALEIELKEAKRLLIAAVESFDKLQKTVISFHSVVCDYAMQFANPYDACNSCPLSNSRYRTCKWRFADEALKLIEGE